MSDLSFLFLRLFHRLPCFLLIGLFLTTAVKVLAADPLVTTTAATGVTDVDAVMNGIVDAMGGSLDVRAEYGTTMSYGSITPAGDTTISGTGAQVLGGFHPVAPLAANTTYHFRLTATDGTNTYEGNDMTFTTLGNRPSVNWVNVAPSGFPGTVVFSAFGVSAGDSPAMISYEYGPTPAYGQVVTDYTPLAAGSYTFQTQTIPSSGIQAGVTYYCRCKVVNQQGTVYSGQTTFTVLTTPVVATTAATGVTDLAAQLNGSVNAEGLLVNTSFQYGLTTAYGQTVTLGTAVTTTGVVPVSAQLPSLLSGTTYHYRLKASIYSFPGADYYGEDQTFTTAAAATPPAVGDITASNLGVTSVRVNCSPIYSGSSPTTVVFQYGLTEAYDSSVTAWETIPRNVANATSSADITGLAPATTYHVRCVLTNAEGTVSSPDITFTTASSPTVTTSAATNVGDLTAVLNGTVDPNGATLPVALSFQLGTSTAYGTTVYATPANLQAAGAFTTNTTHLQPGTIYHYRARAVLENVDYYGPDLTFTTAAASTPPSVSAITSNLSNVTIATLACAVYAGSSQASVFWEYQAAGGALQTASSIPGTQAMDTTVTATGKLTGLQPSTTYTCRCGATNEQGTAYSDYVTFTTLVGATITTGAATSMADVTAVLNGAVNANGPFNYAVSFDLGTTADYGEVFYPTTGNTTSGDTATDFAATATHLLPNTTYHFRLRAMQYSGSGTSIVVLGYQYGADQTFTTGPPATPPTATTLSATGLATTAATLNASVETGSSPATVVFEYGPTTAYGVTCTISTAFDASTTAAPSYLLQGLTANTAYHYRIVVTNGEGTSTGLDASFTTLSPPTVTTNAASVIKATTATLNGTSDKQGGIYTATFDYGQTTAYGLTATPNLNLSSGGSGPIIGNGGGIIIIGGGGPSPDSVAPVGSLQPLTTYHFRLKLTDSYGNSYYGSDATFATLSPVQAWRQQAFSTVSDAGSAADLANPARDGIPNLLKYALSMDPTVQGTAPQPQLKDYSGAQRLSLVFQRDPAKTDLTYEVQAADSPAGPWTTLASSSGGAATSGPGFVVEEPTGGGIGVIIINQGNGIVAPPQPMSVEVRDTISMQDAPRRFMRLQVTRQ